MKIFLCYNLIPKRRDLLSVLSAFVLVSSILSFGLLPCTAHAKDSSQGAKEFINSVTEEAITTLTGKDITKEERARLFRIFMKKHFFINGIAKFVVGRHLRNASEVEKKQYFELFEDLLVATYSERFAKYSGEKLLVKNAEMFGKKDIIVHTSMMKVGETGNPLKVDWRVRNKGEAFTIIDVMIEGISMIMTQKSEFSSFLNSNGGKFEKLLAELKKRVEESTKNNQTAIK